MYLYNVHLYRVSLCFYSVGPRLCSVCPRLYSGGRRQYSIGPRLIMWACICTVYVFGGPLPYSGSLDDQTVCKAGEESGNSRLATFKLNTKFMYVHAIFN